MTEPTKDSPKASLKTRIFNKTNATRVGLAAVAVAGVAYVVVKTKQGQDVTPKAPEKKAKATA